jgi:phosphatidylserine decarboxylase
MDKLRDWLNSPEITELRKLPVSSIVQNDFHRETIVPIYINPEILFAPANGIILYAKEVKNKDSIIMVHGSPFTLRDLIREDIKDEKFIVIGIFMTFYDVHVNYMPSSGYVNYKKLPDLKIDSLSMTKVELEILDYKEHINPANMDYLFYNERMLNTIYDNTLRQEYYIVQIADAEVGAIVPFEESGKFTSQGYGFGSIRFGSQVDLVIPIKEYNKYDLLIKEKIGWHVNAVTDPLVKIIRR